jgi:fatty-acid desaturase
MSCPFKQYKNIFGKEGEGAHSIRLLNIAMVDLVFTIIGALLISYFTNTNFFIIFIILMLMAIILHRLFCVNTTINKFIFGEI